jgi:SAM-dependent methyltransferase
MADFELGETFDFVVCGFDALNYVPPAFLGDFFDRARAHLDPGGHVVFDYSTPKVLREDWARLDYVNHTEEGDLARSHRWDESTGRSVTSLRFLRDEKVLWEEVHVQYALDAYELYRVVARRGFEVRLVRDIDAATYTPSSTTHVWVLTAV